MSERPVIVRVRLYRDNAGEFRFTAYAANNRAIVASTEGYTNRGDALAAANTLFPDVIPTDETRDDG